MSARQVTVLLDGLRFGECLRWQDDRRWFSDFYARQVQSLGVLEEITMPDRCFACALGGADGRTHFVATATTFPGGGDPDWSGRLWGIEVDVPHAGLP